MDQSDRHFVTLPAVALLLAGVESFRGLLDKPEAVSLQLVASALVFASAALFIRAVTGRRTR
jgi:predicted metal-dependent HD superfamily phosphohydrolase